MARATALARLSLDDLAGYADAIARVRCVSGESRWEGGSIWMVTRFDVLETMKGTLPAEITVRLPGGRAGHFVASVEGVPRFSSAEEALLFLEISRAGGFTVVGWVEGTFRIARDALSSIETVTQDSSSFAVFDAATRSFRTEGIRRMPVAEFRERLAGAIARAAERSRGRRVGVQQGKEETR